MLQTVKALPLGSKLAGIVVVLVVAFSGTALAGELPDSIQDPVSDSAAMTGATLPTSDADDSQNPAADLQSDLEDESSKPEESAKPTDNHGAEVSAVATDKTAIDGNHGGAVSAVASKNKSYSEQNQGEETEITASNGNHGSEMSASASGKSKK